jgi:hypothetical protein
MALLICSSGVQVRAHGDPELQEERILTIAVDNNAAASSAGLSSEAFRLVVPPNTVELLWRVDSPQKADIAFAVLHDTKVLVDGLKDGSKSRIPKSDTLKIGNVSGTGDPFVVQVYAHTVHWDH